MTPWRSPALRSLLGYLVVLGFLMHPWWSTATDAVAPGNDPRDARLIVWILGWVAHALAHAPARLFDAPIFFPAPGQLAGSEHFLSAQLVFAPIYWAGGNAVLAANVAALLSYPASALAMERLLAAHGLARGAAWFGGLAFALGVLRVPQSLHVLQYLTLFLPLVALRIQRLRERPSAGAMLLLGGCLLAGMFSSYYLAALLVVSTVVWSAFEATRTAEARGRLLALIALAGAGASGTLAWFSRPYFHRLTMLAADKPSDDAFWAAAGRTLLGMDLHDPVWLLLAALALAGVATNLARGRRRGLAVTATALIGIGVLLLLFGWPWPLSRWFGFFRDRLRYLLLASVGFNVLVALGYDALRARVPSRWAGTALFLALTGVLVWDRMGMFTLASDPVLAESRDRDAYRGLAAIVREHGGGPVLELPYVSTPLVDHAPEQMVGQLRHGMPLVNGFTGYRPQHLPLVESLIAAVPAVPALDDLVDLTHLRWIVIRPEGEWQDTAQRRRLLAGLARYPGRGPSWTVGPWVVQRLDRVPKHDAWFAALAAGPRAGRSVLGTPLAPMAESDAIASISARVSSGPVSARWFVGIEASATNRGSAAWPTWGAGGWNGPGLAQWQARWRRADDAQAPWSALQAFPLRHDVAPGETLAQQLIVPTPEQPGSYELQITVAQQDGATFSAPGNVVGTMRLDVAPARR